MPRFAGTVPLLDGRRGTVPNRPRPTGVRQAVTGLNAEFAFWSPHHPITPSPLHPITRDPPSDLRSGTWGKLPLPSPGYQSHDAAELRFAGRNPRKEVRTMRRHWWDRGARGGRGRMATAGLSGAALFMMHSSSSTAASSWMTTPPPPQPSPGGPAAQQDSRPTNRRRPAVSGGGGNRTRVLWRSCCGFYVCSSLIDLVAGGSTHKAVLRPVHHLSRVRRSGRWPDASPTW